VPPAAKVIDSGVINHLRRFRRCCVQGDDELGEIYFDVATAPHSPGTPTAPASTWTAPPGEAPGPSCAKSCKLTSCLMMAPVVTTQCAPIHAPVCTTAAITAPGPRLAVGYTQPVRETGSRLPACLSVTRRTSQSQHSESGTAGGDRCVIAQPGKSQAFNRHFAMLEIHKNEQLRRRFHTEDRLRQHPGVLTASSQTRRRGPV
jgi:hypothetical protein